MSDEEFESYVREGIDAIPEEFAKHVDNVAVVVQDMPTPEQAHKLQLRPHSLLFGLYEGTPKPKRRDTPWSLPDKITIFKYPALAVSRTREEVRQHVMKTVWHEFGHHFGLSDAQIHELEENKLNSTN